jgi:hypothetical protein
MQSTDIQAFVEQDENLDLLLNQKDIYFYSDFSGEEYNNDTLKLHIAEDYYNSFKEVYAKYVNGKGSGKLIPLLKSINYLATPEVEQKIVSDVIKPAIQQSHQTLSELKAKLSEKNIETYLLTIKEPLTPLVLEMMNQFETNDQIKGMTNEILEMSLDICDEVSKANPSKEPVKYGIYNAMINNLRKITNLGTLRERYSKHRLNITDVREDVDNNYMIWVIIGIVIFVIRVLAKML